MAKQPESRLQQKIQRALRKLGGWWYKVWGGPFTPAGIPDLIGCVNGMFFALEVKRPVKSSKTSVIQDETIADIRSAGGHSTVVRSVEEALAFVTRARDRDALAALQLIANGHNDPRRLARQVLGWETDDDD